MKVVVEDKNRIKEVVFKYPHLMSGTAANDIKEEFISKSELFSLVFETKEEEQVDRVTVNGAVINPTDASNKNYGLK